MAFFLCFNCSGNGLGLINKYLKMLFPSFSFPIYGLALVCSIFLHKLLEIVHLSDFVDKKLLRILVVVQQII